MAGNVKLGVDLVADDSSVKKALKALNKEARAVERESKAKAREAQKDHRQELKRVKELQSHHNKALKDRDRQQKKIFEDQRRSEII